MASIYEHLKSTKGVGIIRNGWKAAGITKAVADARNGVDNKKRVVSTFLCNLCILFRHKSLTRNRYTAS